MRGQSPAPSSTALGSPGPGSGPWLCFRVQQEEGAGGLSTAGCGVARTPPGQAWPLCREGAQQRALPSPCQRGPSRGDGWGWETGQWGSLHSPPALPSQGWERKTGAISHGSARRSKGSAIPWGPPSSLGHWQPARPGSPRPLSGCSSLHRKTQGPAKAQAPPSPHPVLRKMARRVPAPGSSANRHGLLTARLLRTQDHGGGGS